ncbi:VAN3-binding protein-like [Hordeum vulgare]|nr:VAN3-binding protein-like [Hordeum vulgare]
MNVWCKEGTLLKRSQKGALRKRLSMYMNKRSLVNVKLKSKRIGGDFSKKKRSVMHTTTCRCGRQGMIPRAGCTRRHCLAPALLRVARHIVQAEVRRPTRST